MIEILKGFPDTVLAAKASGEITTEDYRDVLVPVAEAKFAKHGKVRVYYEIGADFSAMDFGAMWEDTRLGLGHWSDWDKIAIVTDVGWIADTMKLMKVFMPQPIRVFSGAEANEARDWVSSD